MGSGSTKGGGGGDLKRSTNTAQRFKDQRNRRENLRYKAYGNTPAPF
jgi:hypothetical protein